MKYILKDLKSYVPQGICEINKKYYITMYDSNHELNSKIRLLEKLKDKSEVIKILDDTINMHSDETVKENARSVKSLLELS